MPSITTSDGVRLCYEAAGTGEPVVLLHGLGGCAGDWGPQFDHLAGTHQVVTLDVRGHGDSDKPDGPYSVPRVAAAVRVVLEHLDATPAHVVGLSMGGMVAFQLALDSPDAVRSLMIVNSGPRSVPKGPRGWLFLQLRRIMARLVPPAKFADKLGPKLFPDPEHTDVLEAFKRRYARNDPRAYREAVEALAGWAVEEQIHTIEAPTLFVSSDQDYTAPELKQRFADLMPNASLVVIDDAHHAVNLERPDAFNAVVDHWLQQVRTPESATG